MLQFIRAQPAPYFGTDEDLSKALFIGYRSIARYLRYLRGIGHIETVVATKPVDGTWMNHRKILVTSKSQFGLIE